MNVLNINFFLLPLLNLCTARSLFSPLVLLAPHLSSRPLSRPPTIFSKNHQSLISLCITLGYLWNQLPVSFRQPYLLMICHTYLPPAHHSHPPSHIHCFIPGSKLTLFTNLFHHSLLAPTWTAFSDYTGPDLLCSTVFHFYFVLFIYLFFTLGRAVD